MQSDQEIFQQFVGLVGREIEVGVRSTGERLTGKVENAMFDSFLLNVRGKNRAIFFRDLVYLNHK